MENLLLLHPNGKRAMEEELIRGRDMANQLLEVLIEDHDDNKSNIIIVVETIKGQKRKCFHWLKILCERYSKSFTNTLLLLNTNGGSGDVVAPVTVGDFLRRSGRRVWMQRARVSRQSTKKIKEGRTRESKINHIINN